MGMSGNMPHYNWSGRLCGPTVENPVYIQPCTAPRRKLSVLYKTPITLVGVKPVN